MKLWLDDMRPAPNGWVHARTVEEAQAYLRTGDVEEASLDHDLGACGACIAKGVHVGDMETPETTFYMHCEHVKDGMSLCVWMAQFNLWPEHKPAVHSMNPVGAAAMRQTIDRYGPYR